VEVFPAPIRCIIDGPQKTFFNIGSGGTLSIKGSNSYDTDAKSISPLKYVWSCTDYAVTANAARECISRDSSPLISPQSPFNNKAVLSIDSEMLDPNNVYKFSLTVSSSSSSVNTPMAQTYTRSSTCYVIVSTGYANAATGNLAESAPAFISMKSHESGLTSIRRDPNVLYAFPNNALSFTYDFKKYRIKVEPRLAKDKSTIGKVPALGKKVVNLAGLTPQMLPGVKYTFSLELMRDPRFSSSYSYIVLERPTGGRLNVFPKTVRGADTSTLFSLTQYGWNFNVDDLPLRYKFEFISVSKNTPALNIYQKEQWTTLADNQVNPWVRATLLNVEIAKCSRYQGAYGVSPTQDRLKRLPNLFIQRYNTDRNICATSDASESMLAIGYGLRGVIYTRYNLMSPTETIYVSNLGTCIFVLAIVLFKNAFALFRSFLVL
jgi:hypothetical protein